MASTALFDGFLPSPQSSHRVRAESLVVDDVNNVDPLPSQSPSSSSSRMRLGLDDDQQRMPRSPVQVEEQHVRGDDEHTLVGSEHEEPVLPRNNNHRQRAGSALPTPTPSTVSFNVPVINTPTQSHVPSRSSSQRQQQQPQQQQQGTTSSQSVRKPAASIPPGARIR